MKMQNVLMLKTPGGKSAGYARLTRTATGVELTLGGAWPKALRMAALYEGEEGQEAHADEAGRVLLPRVPQALAFLGEDGRLSALGACMIGSGIWAEALVRTRRILNWERAAAKEQEDALPQVEKETQADAQQEARCDAAPPHGEAAAHVQSCQSAWPPPPFFQEARFIQGAWQA